MARQRQERAERTRLALIRAAAEVFDQSGYHGAGLNAILQKAGTTTGAMYFHFRSKEDLARAVIVEQAAELHWPVDHKGLQQLVDVCQYLAVEMRSNVLFRAGVRLAVEQSEVNLLDYSIYDWWAEQFRAHLAEARELGQLHPDVDEDAYPQVIVAAYTGSQIMSRLASDRADLPARIENMLRCLLPALAPAEVIAALEFPGAGAVPADKEKVPEKEQGPRQGQGAERDAEHQPEQEPEADAVQAAAGKPARKKTAAKGGSS
ncbi:ScbR family autoregulator-binding transcription factor [Streptomyces sp. WMMC940]|uniref:ScbR family autoregulator-binding transcription factor n=1 Tax=Streptomyces sp. WMMC940 TaxID=3015153 RepID=UPI0022B6CB6E|nr:ScbR family autoregulator-binding transcription factor [Streptomyces sp. WMMC940]MCZ7458942.1 ScbR family autoregulator-binding transcription factor [Streptomyces sp. WMMC940]